MDFRKIIEQAVREIKREVNLKVLQVPEIEQKVLDATSDEPWGPHGSALAEIAQATKKYSDCQMIMNVLWSRLTDTSSHWRHVYKALAVIEYLVANGSERALDDIVERSYRISSLSGFEYVEPNGKDVGLNVRKKVETLLAIIKDKEKIQEARNKAATNRDKYFGLSSTGISFKSGSASHTGSSFRDNEGYGGVSGGKGIDICEADYGESNQDGIGSDSSHNRRGIHDKCEDKYPHINEGTKPKDRTTQLRRDSLQSIGTKSSSRHHSLTPEAINTPTEIYDDDFNPRGPSTSEFDDFNPRGSFNSGPVATNPKSVDIFGDSLVSGFMDAPPLPSTKIISDHDIDLFADASFVSVHPESSGSVMQNQLDFFADQLAATVSVSNADVLTKLDSGIPTETKPVLTEKSTIGAFAAMPLRDPVSDLLGAFSTSSGSANSEPSMNHVDDISDNQNQSTLVSPNSAPKKANFQVKSSIWADSLSRGIIDLDLTAPTKLPLADIGIAGGFTDGLEEKEKRPPASMFMGRSLGAAGTVPGRPTFPSSSTASWK